MAADAATRAASAAAIRPDRPERRARAAATRSGSHSTGGGGFGHGAAGYSRALRSALALPGLFHRPECDIGARSSRQARQVRVAATGNGSYPLGGRPQEDKAMARRPTDHPDYHFIKVVMTNGTEYDPVHLRQRGRYAPPRHRPEHRRPGPAASSNFADRGGRVSRFTSKFGNIGARK